MPRMLTGLDRVVAGEVSFPRSAHVALLSNFSARSAHGVWAGSVLRDRGCDLRLLLSPEHGLAGQIEAGGPVGHGSRDGLPVLSLYGGEPDAIESALSTVDLLLVDLPDVGCRYYTYPWTIIETLKFAAQHGKRVILLDRPNPLGGGVEGSLPDAGVYAAVCACRVPVRHGLSLGELTLWNRHTYAIDVHLEIVRCTGWRRSMTWDVFERSWVPPSPALTTFRAAQVYPGTCLLEGTNLSEGRGTDHPFVLVGAPFLDPATLIAALSCHPACMGISLRAAEFVPACGKWARERCLGLALDVLDSAGARPVAAGLAIVEAAMRFPEFEFNTHVFDALAGTSSWRQCLEAGVSAADIAAEWAADEQRFLGDRRAIELY